jgi:hypothetical protein
MMIVRMAIAIAKDASLQERMNSPLERREVRLRGLLAGIGAAGRVMVCDESGRGGAISICDLLMPPFLAA